MFKMIKLKKKIRKKRIFWLCEHFSQKVLTLELFCNYKSCGEFNYLLNKISLFKICDILKNAMIYLSIYFFENLKTRFSWKRFNFWIFWFHFWIQRKISHEKLWSDCVFTKLLRSVIKSLILEAYVLESDFFASFCFIYNFIISCPIFTIFVIFDR